MGEAQREIPGVSAARQNRNLVLACKRVTESWFPVNTELLKRIQTGFTNGAYDLGIDFLMSEIKTDFSLFTYCLRESRKTLQKKGVALPDDLAPTDLLRWCGIDGLKEILSVEAEKISPHRLDKVNELQMMRLEEAMVGASTAQALAVKKDVDPDLGFSTELMRQLGLTLIAWNYPTIYQRTVSSLKTGVAMDDELTKVLGFSPGLLGIAMARQWSLAPELRLALGDKDAVQSLPPIKADQVRATADTLSHICEIGEALARANNPEHYPTARNDWYTARDAIVELLGQDGMQIIQEQVKQNCENYLTAAPDIFQSALDVRKEPTISDRARKELLERNRYIKQCPNELQDALLKLYEELDPNLVGRDQIGVLVKEVIPLAGFECGCIFLLDPESMRLVPRLKIGDVLLSAFRERSALSISTRSDDPILAAYECNSPIVESKGGLSIKGQASITCMIGNSQRRVGVLYLELSEAFLNSRTANPLMCFKAISQALNDCLKL